MDNDGDGKNDYINVKISLNVDGSKIRNIAFIQSAAYSINQKVSADLQVTFTSQFATPNGLSKLTAQGTLDLVQRE
jgi:hypothetical protein